MKTIINQLQLLLILVVAFISFNAEAAPSAESAAMFKKNAEDCIKEGSLNAEDTARIMANEIFSPKYKEASDKLQCFLVCVYKKIGIIDAAGKENIELFSQNMAQRYPDKKDKLKGALSKCDDDIKTQNPCEIVYQYEKCVTQAIMA